MAMQVEHNTPKTTSRF